MSKTPVDELDGCELDFTEGEPTSDNDITGWVLFASSEDENLEEISDFWKELDK